VPLLGKTGIGRNERKPCHGAHQVRLGIFDVAATERRVRRTNRISAGVVRHADEERFVPHVLFHFQAFGREVGEDAIFGRLGLELDEEALGDQDLLRGICR
jgi:hypothetical protein